MPHRYGMFSHAGGRRVATLVKRVSKFVFNGEYGKALELYHNLHKSIAVKYDEVYDTAVREYIWDGIDEIVGKAEGAEFYEYYGTH